MSCHKLSKLKLNEAKTLWLEILIRFRIIAIKLLALKCKT